MPAIGVDIGGSTTKIAVVNADGSVDGLRVIPTAGPAAAFIDQLVSNIAALGGGDVGVGVAGFVDDEREMMFYNPNLAWLEGVPLRRILEQRLARRVMLDADSNVACAAEHRWGVGRGVRRFLCVTLGTGVGVGMIVNGEILRIAHGGLGDAGHVIVEPFGDECGSGCRGCAEAMISASAVERRFGSNVREIIERAVGGDAAAVEVLRGVGTLLGVALASMVVMLFPEVIAVAGGLSEAGHLLLEPARESLAKSVGPYYREGLRVEKAAFGWQSTLVGAAIRITN